MSTNDDIKTIREALVNIANRLSPNSLPIDARMEGPEGHFVRQEADRSFDDARTALAAIDRLEAQRGLTVDEVMDIFLKWDEQAKDDIIPMIPDLRARLTAKLQDR